MDFRKSENSAIRSIPLKNTPLYKNTPPIPPPILIGGVFLYKPAAGGKFLGYIHHFLRGIYPFMKGKLIILEGQIAVKMKENDAREKQKVFFFWGA